MSGSAGFGLQNEARIQLGEITDWLAKSAFKVRSPPLSSEGGAGGGLGPPGF